MNIRARDVLCTALITISSASAFATQITGPIQNLKVVNSSGSSGRVQFRISTSVGTAGLCSGVPAGVYGFENPDTGIGKVMVSTLLTAYSLGKDVTIVGDDTCHLFVELPASSVLEGVKQIQLTQ